MRSGTGSTMKLFVNKHGKPLGELELAPGETTIGRRADNDIVLSDRAVSGRHARIHLAQGQATVQDLDSTNGTLVNGRRISTHPLADGDMISIGNYRLALGRDESLVGDPGPPTQILRLDRPGMPPGIVDERSTRRIREWRARYPGAQGALPAEARAMRLRIMSGCNRGRHLDLLAPVTALGEPGEEVVVLMRDGDGLSMRPVHAGSGRIRVNNAPLGDGSRPLRHNDVIEVGDVRMTVVFEAGTEELTAGTENWSLE
jgi:hypothetical protein